MNRCFSRMKPASRRGACLLATALALAALSPLAGAQTAPVRQFPAKALRGTLVVTQPPAIMLDGKSARLSPGARIRSATNMLVLSASLVGQELTVNYTTEQHGLVHDVWILTEAEAAEKRQRAGD